MANGPENPLLKAEKDNFKFGGLTAALGLVAAIGSLAIPNHNRALVHLEESVAAAGTGLFLVGTCQALEAMNQVDELDKDI